MKVSCQTVYLPFCGELSVLTAHPSTSLETPQKGALRSGRCCTVNPLHVPHLISDFKYSFLAFPCWSQESTDLVSFYHTSQSPSSLFLIFCFYFLNGSPPTLPCLGCSVVFFHCLTHFLRCHYHLPMTILMSSSLASFPHISEHSIFPVKLFQRLSPPPFLAFIWCITLTILSAGFPHILVLLPRAS